MCLNIARLEDQQNNFIVYKLYLCTQFSYEKRIKASNFQLTKDHNCGVPQNSLDSSDGTKIGKT